MSGAIWGADAGLRALLRSQASNLAFGFESGLLPRLRDRCFEDNRRPM